MKVRLRNIFLGVVIILILIACFSMQVMATDYYFSTSGNDANTGLSAASPFQTLTKLNAIFPTRLPGDRFLLKRGDTFYGFLIIGRSGTSSAHMIIDAYGTGANPTITGFTTLGVWSSVGSGVWETPVTTALLPFVNMVTVDGVNTAMGRWPDADAPDGGFMKFESFVGTSSITDAQLTSTPNWTGAEVVIKPWPWLINRAIVTSHSGGTLSFVGDQQPRSAGYGYFIQNDVRTLTKFGEWFHNKSTERIRMYFGAENPADHVIQVATIDSLLYSTGKHYITVNNITFKGGNGNIIKMLGATTGFTIDNCHIQFAGINGVWPQSNITNFRLTNSNVWDCNNDCVRGNALVTNAYIANNSIRNSYLIPGAGGERDGQGHGIRTGAGALIEYNSVVNSGYIGITFAGSNTTVQNNFIDSSCLTKTDAGGIYSGLTGGYVAYTNRKLLNNIILNAIGNNHGTPSVEHAAHPIYLDDNLNGVLIEGNTLANSNNAGIMLHNCRDITVRNNTIYNNHLGQINVNDDGNHLSSSGIRIAGNIMVTTDVTQSTLILEDELDAIGGQGTLDSNIYANLLSRNTSIINVRNNLAIYEYHDLSSWRLRYGDDANGSYSLKNVAPYRDLALVGASKISSPLNNSTMTNSGTGWSNASFVASGSGLDGGALQITPNATAIQSTAINVGSLLGGTPYVVRFSVKATTYSNQGSFGVRVRGSTNTITQYHKIKTTREEVEMLFVTAVGTASATLEFLVSEGGTTFYLDNIYFYQATATVTVPEDSIRFEYNASQAATVVPLSGTYRDVYGDSYTTSVTLQPYTSKILIFETGATTPVVKTDPVITWPAPGPLTYGTTLGATELDATANVAGTFNYSYASGTLLNAGTYTISLTFIPTTQTLYNTVTTTRSITINKAVATMTYTDLEKTYTGLPLAPDIVTSPAGLGTINTLYNVKGSTPTNAGSYTVTSDLVNNNYTASSISGTFVIAKAPATITVISSLTQEADGNPKPVQITTNPAGKTVTILYNGSATAPSAVGAYDVDIDIVDANYSGTLSVTLNIVASVADIFITNILQTYDGTSKSVTVTSPYSYAVTYNPATHVNAGSYQVIATINDGVHSGADTATFVIQKATPILTWPTPERIFVGTPLSATQLNATSSVAGTWSYSQPLGTVLPIGTHLITATFTPTDQTNYNSATITVPIAVYGDVLNLYITNGRTIYINSP